MLIMISLLNSDPIYEHFTSVLFCVILTELGVKCLTGLKNSEVESLQFKCIVFKMGFQGRYLRTY